MPHWNHIKKIHDKNKLLAHLILNSPEGSIWKADGINDQKIIGFLEKYLTEDCKKAWQKIGDSEKDFFEIKLNEANQKIIDKEVLNWNLEQNLQDQDIIYDGIKFVESFDYFDDSCTWILDKIDLSLPEKAGWIELEKR